MRPTLLGFGDLVVDHSFMKVGNLYRYIGSRGGGSIGNIVWNFQAAGGQTSFVGEVNAGLPQTIAIDDLAISGCDVLATVRNYT